MTMSATNPYMIIKNRLSDLYRELNTGDYDRAEVRLCGIDVRLWRTRINCRVRIHLGYKSPFPQLGYHKISKNDLTEMLYKRKDAL